jgi:hypothetical protein
VFAALPPCVLGLMAWNLTHLFRRHGAVVGKREILLLSAVASGTLLVAVTELLGAFRLLFLVPLAAAWCMVAAALAASGTVLSRKREPGTPAESSSRPRPLRLVTACVVAILAGTFLAAVLAPPNTFDSMTYHMARVAHWVENESLANYPTSILRQLYAAPGAELFALNFQILSGGDHLANLVQWLALPGCIMAASLLAKALGADAAGQAIAGFVMATLPTAVLQASSTQNDLFAAFWVLVFVLFFLEWKAKPDPWRGAAAGAALGLAALTKVTALFAALPFLLIFGGGALAVSPKRRFPAVGAALALFLLLNLGQVLRNVALVGDPLGARADQTNVRVRAVSFPLFVLNAVRSAAMHLGTPFEKVNQKLEEGILALHRGLGVDAADERSSYLGMRFSVTRFSLHEDTAGNPVHLVLAAAAAALCLRKDFRERPSARPYVAAALAGALLFPLILSWQPWIARLHLPVFALWCPVVAVALRSAAVPRALSTTVLAVLFVGALPALLRNSSRPLTGPRTILRSERMSDIFRNAPEREAPYREAVRILAGLRCREVGVALGANDWEYPLFALAGKGTRFEHVAVNNVSARAASRPFAPCAVFSTVEEIPPGFKAGWTSGGVSLLFPR